MQTTYPRRSLLINSKGVVANIAAVGCLGFCDDELPPEGKAHNRALHISIEYDDTILSIVLVDTGSSLNVLQKNSLTKLTIEGLLMKPSTLIVQAFDGSRRSVVGEVDLPIKIWPGVKLLGAAEGRFQWKRCEIKTHIRLSIHTLIVLLLSHFDGAKEKLIIVTKIRSGKKLAEPKLLRY